MLDDLRDRESFERLDACTAISRALAPHGAADLHGGAAVDALGSWRDRRETAFRRLSLPSPRPSTTMAKPSKRRSPRPPVRR